MPLVRASDPAAKNGMVRSHRFAAAHTALPFVNGDRAQLDAVQTFLRDGQISVDVFGIVRGADADAPEPTSGPGLRPQRGAAEPQLSSTFAVGEESIDFGAAPAILRPPAEVIAPLGKVEGWVRRGESARVEVIVR